MKTLDKTAPKEDQSYKYITFAMCYIALASELMYVDGPANKVEIQSLANSFTNIQDNITELVILARSDSLSKEYYLGKIGKLFHNNPRILQDLMNNLVKIAISDGFITNKETEWLIEAGKFFGFLKSKIIDLIWYHIKEDMFEPYCLLGLDQKKINMELVTKNYHYYARIYHPDRSNSSDVSKEFVSEANRRFHLLTSLYKKAKNKS